MQQLLTQLATVAAIVGGLAAIAALVAAVTRLPRLRQTEVHWRGLLEADLESAMPSGQRQLAEDLHRHTVAELISHELISSRRFAFRWFLLTAGAGVASLLGWHLIHSVSLAPDESIRTHLATVGLLTPTAPLLLLVFLVLLADTVATLVGHHCARNAIVRDVLSDAFPLTTASATWGMTYLRLHQPATHRWSLIWRVYLLTFLGMVVSAAAAGLTALPWWGWIRDPAPEIPGTTAGMVLVLYLCVLLGLVAVFVLWHKLIRPSAPELATAAIQEVTRLEPAVPRSGAGSSHSEPAAPHVPAREVIASLRRTLTLTWRRKDREG